MRDAPAPDDVNVGHGEKPKLRHKPAFDGFVDPARWVLFQSLTVWAFWFFDVSSSFARHAVAYSAWPLPGPAVSQIGHSRSYASRKSARAIPAWVQMTRSVDPLMVR